MTRIGDRLSYHAVYDGSILEALQFAKAGGFSGIQIADETPHLSFERLSDTEIDRIADFIRSEKMYATLHAPDQTASLFQCSRHISAGVAAYYGALFSFARRIDARLVTIHLGAMTEFPADDATGRRIPQDDLPLYSEALRRNVETVLSRAGGKTLVCVENYGFGESEMALLAPYLGRDGLFLCWDLVKGMAQPHIEAFYLDHPAWIKQVHLHDRRQTLSGSFTGHRTIGTGDIDFSRAIRFLLQNADVEDFCIEVRPREKARESLLALARTVTEIGAEQEA